ncbi:PilZ domain-containing protein [Acetivibrio mesophilus]|uniref:PilZ domain-containing protein n=1 Tax=Acetivibrio mesophilus TaxID=2487273 RepID=A0A4Q0I2B9_9FIRM|nr:PilZ domain-containing protein [Acetivibrio mesophilus]ODM25423.1 pilus assembly protein PilZ [Clostridium sp. Bc-iso-3]RXE58348.1 PilZ domain-containing protein [Acetivibrio mesophilus]HHV28905.1 PilZ domain-containing protein [Clostridium sp.]
MKLKVGEIVTLKHYSAKKSNRGIISNLFDNSVVIKPERDFLIYSFFDSDPVVIGFESENVVNLCESTVKHVDYNQNTFNLTINNIQSITNKRLTQRFPVSLCAYIINHNARVFSYIRNISLDGLSLCSKQEFKKGDIFTVNTKIENIELTFEAQVMWKKMSELGFEYGLAYYMPKAEFSKTIERCLEFLTMDQEISISRLKYEFEPLRRINQKKVVMN